jgi:serine protease AprX
MKKLLLLIGIILIADLAQAQLSRYLVKFKNKATTPYSFSNPTAYLTQRAIDRRTAYGITIDSTDLPITPRYIDSVRLAGSVTILNRSKWLNQISIQTTDASALTKINAFPFVESVSNIAARSMVTIENTTPKFEALKNITDANVVARNQSTQDYFNYGNTTTEIKLQNGDFLHNIGMRGQGMLVAVLDAGFYQYKTLPSFDSMNTNNQVVQTWDFVARDTSVVEDDSHGMSCLSTIAGNIPGTFVGNAPKANFALYRTEESATEYPIEEFNWVCGLERADSIGAQIASTSLGYTTFDNATFDHTYSQMNGKTTTAAKGGTFAHRKGLLLFSAMGNDGNNSWKYLSTPADIDSTIAVGAVTSAGVVGGFSSYGPAFDGRVKPEASAPGVSVYVQSAGGSIVTGNGTSYACPKMAGLGTCLWQAFPEFNNYTIRDAIIKSGSIYNTPNDRIGYGIPDMKKAFVQLLNRYAKITSATSTNCKTTLVWNSKDVGSMKYEIERKLPSDINYIKVGELAGSGTILSNKTGLQFLDNTILNGTSGTIKYRIKQIVDTSSAGLTSTYFDSASVVIAAPCVVLSLYGGGGVYTSTINVLKDKVVVMPTPVSAPQFTLRVETVKPVNNLTIRITDMAGRIIEQFKQSKLAGRTDYTIDISNYARGTYIVSVYKDNLLIDNGRLFKL